LKYLHHFNVLLRTFVYEENNFLILDGWIESNPLTNFLFGGWVERICTR